MITINKRTKQALVHSKIYSIERNECQECAKHTLRVKSAKRLKKATQAYKIGLRRHLEIVYYTTREVRSRPVASPSARVAIYTCSGVALFIPMLRIYHIRVSEPEAKVVLSARVW